MKEKNEVRYNNFLDCCSNANVRDIIVIDPNASQSFRTKLNWQTLRCVSEQMKTNSSNEQVLSFGLGTVLIYQPSYKIPQKLLRYTKLLSCGSSFKEFH